MPTTSNFGWTTPADTDLVKDGAAAIRTLGNGVDASFVDLKGGTTGQILSKNSNTDLDFVWIANDQGDITEVTAGTGLSGGGTSGAVTLTNTMATEITASGDIIVGTGSGTFDNLPIGTTGQVLTADTTVSPYKVKWASVSSGGITQLATGTLSGTSVTLSSISQSYKHLQLVLQNPKMNSSERVGIRWNGSSGTYVTTAWIWDGSGTYTTSSQAYGTWQPVPTSNDNLHCFIEFLDYTYAGRQIIRATVNDQPNTQGHVNMRYNNNDNAAITEITIRTFNGTATFSGGTYTLFGVA